MYNVQNMHRMGSHAIYFIHTYATCNMPYFSACIFKLKNKHKKTTTLTLITNVSRVAYVASASHQQQNVSIIVNIGDDNFLSVPHSRFLSIQRCKLGDARLNCFANQHSRNWLQKHVSSTQNCRFRQTDKADSVITVIEQVDERSKQHHSLVVVRGPASNHSTEETAHRGKGAEIAHCCLFKQAFYLGLVCVRTMLPYFKSFVLLTLKRVIPPVPI
ncbi:hypothetical protein HELRODRAFT_171829 [Helobdella robusta]|uniref:Uncharacterized protein n=1 Tax=Helobdella robusta TaxID=6412 RepID=T1F4R2_HELRO|nr:hypothetical protein HELRODRAFT_171829 [Helobdella robusta]ESO05427.1 hypothetical protein HELRODRAFT_171829 [Helobdella robusta]